MPRDGVRSGRVLGGVAGALALYLSLGACAGAKRSVPLDRGSLEQQLATRLVALAQAPGVRTRDVAQVVRHQGLMIPDTTRRSLLDTADIALPDEVTKASLLAAVAEASGCERAIALSDDVSTFGLGLLVAMPCFQPVFERFRVDAVSPKGNALEDWLDGGIKVAAKAGQRPDVERFVDAASTLLLDLPPTPWRTLALAHLCDAYRALKAPNRAERLGAQTLANLPLITLSAQGQTEVLTRVAPALADSEHLARLVAETYKRSVTDGLRVEVAVLAARRSMPRADISVAAMLGKVSTDTRPWLRAEIAGLMGDRPGLVRWLNVGLARQDSASLTARRAVIAGADGAVVTALEAVRSRSHRDQLVSGALAGTLELKDWSSAALWLDRLSGEELHRGRLAMASALGADGRVARAAGLLAKSLPLATAAQAEEVAKVAAVLGSFEWTLRAIVRAKTSSRAALGATLALADGQARGLWPRRLNARQEALWIAAVL